MKATLPILHRLLVLVLFAAAFAMMPLPAHPQSVDAPALLVAAPEMGGYYRNTVILAVPVGNEHIGVILNRPLDKTLADLFPGHAPSAAVPGAVHIGGPALPSSIFAMVYAGASPGGVSLMLLPGVWFVGGSDAVDRIIETRPKDARFYSGFVGWREGELAGEVKKGFFTIRPVDKSKLFLRDTSQLYELLVPKKGQVQT